jgi:hypothetical protein
MDAVPLAPAFDARVKAAVRNSLKPMLLFTIVVLGIAIGLSVWSHDNEKRQRAVAFWTGGLGVIGVIAVGCMAIVVVYGAYVFDDSLRTVENEVGGISLAISKMSERFGSGVRQVGKLVEGR